MGIQSKLIILLSFFFLSNTLHLDFASTITSSPSEKVSVIFDYDLDGLNPVFKPKFQGKDDLIQYYSFNLKSSKSTLRDILHTPFKIRHPFFIDISERGPPHNS